MRCEVCEREVTPGTKWCSKCFGRLCVDCCNENQGDDPAVLTFEPSPPAKEAELCPT